MKNGKLIFSISFLLIIICAICTSYFYVSKYNKNKDSTYINYNLSKSEETDLLNIVSKYRLMSFYKSDSGVKINKNNFNKYAEYMFMYFMYKDIDNFKTHFLSDNKWYISIKDVDEYFESLYGFTLTDYEDIKCSNEGEVLLYYDKENKGYVYNDEHPGHGIYTSDYLDYHVTNSKKDKDLYIIDILFLYGSNAEGYYVNEKELSIDFIEEPSDYDKAHISYFESNIKSFESIPKYEYVFKKVGNNYYLKEFKVVK